MAVYENFYKKDPIVMCMLPPISKECGENIFLNYLDYLNKFMSLIPQKIDDDFKSSPTDFVRDSKLTFPKTVVFTLHAAASGKSKGIDIKSGEFFKNARRSHLWLEADAVHRSAITKAREKINWRCFENIFYKTVDLAYELWPESEDFLWHGMSVYAIDGSKVDLPASYEIREEFDPDSGLENRGRGHYPQCLVSTVYDVFRRIPVARTVVSIKEADEREEVKKMIPYIPAGNVLLFDRGYPGYELIKYLNETYSGYYIFRCPASHTFPAVEQFIKSNKEEAIIWIDPTNNYKKKLTAKERKKLTSIKLRIVKLVSPDGEVSVLLTNLFDKKEYPNSGIIELYFKRWGVENHYRDEKVILEIEKFHSKSCNGIMQEFFAILIMSVISRVLMILTSKYFSPSPIEPQFKNAIMTLASDAAILTPDFPEKAIEIFEDIIREISRVKYYRPKEPRPTQPRVSKKPINKWIVGKTKKSRSP